MDLKRKKAPRVCIIGAGAIGCMLAVRLEEAGCSVTLTEHRAQRAAIRRQTGITLMQYTECILAHPTIVSSAEFITECDLVFICTKAYDTESAVKSLAQIADLKPIAVSLQNGIGNAELIAPLAPGRTLCAVTATGVLLRDESNVRLTGTGMTGIAPYGQTPSGLAEPVADILRQAGFETRIASDTPAMLWSKLLINAAINPVTALFKITNGELPHHTEACRLACDIARETESVAAAQGISLEYSDGIKAFTEVCLATAANCSSMLCDIERRRPTEIDAINGAIIRTAAKAGIPVPANREAYSRIKELAGR